jgi:hypothetical protein
MALPKVTEAEMREKRDIKVNGAMAQLAPIWLVNEEYRPHEDSVLFNLVYTNPVYGWVSQRFKYDGFNDVLYHMGERRLTEDEVLPVQEQEPYINGEVATNVPNQPANRPSPPLPHIIRK